MLVLEDGSERNMAYPKLAQLHADGQVDTGFGRQGVVVAPLGVDLGSQRPHAGTLLPDGCVLLAGAPWRTPGGQRALLSRWCEDGSRDTDFGDRGSLSCAFASTANDDSVRVDSVCGVHAVDGRILVAGHMLEYEVRYKFCAVGLHL